MKKQYEYTVGCFKLHTREAARMIRRSLLSDEAVAKLGPAPKIIQKVTIERVVR